MQNNTISSSGEPSQQQQQQRTPQLPCSQETLAMVIDTLERLRALGPAPPSSSAVPGPDKNKVASDALMRLARRLLTGTHAKGRPVPAQVLVSGDVDMESAASSSSSSSSSSDASGDIVEITRGGSSKASTTLSLCLVPEYFSPAELDVQNLAASQRLMTVVPGSERVLVSTDTTALSVYQVQQLMIQVTSTRYLRRNVALPSPYLRSLQSFGAAAKAHRAWLVDEAVRRSLPQQPASATASGGTITSENWHENFGFEEYMRSLARACGPAFVESELLGSALVLSDTDQESVSTQQQSLNNRMNFHMRLRAQELTALLSPSVSPLEIEQKLAATQTRAEQARVRVERLAAEKTELENVEHGRTSDKSAPSSYSKPSAAPASLEPPLPSERAAVLSDADRLTAQVELKSIHLMKVQHAVRRRVQRVHQSELLALALRDTATCNLGTSSEQGARQGLAEKSHRPTPFSLRRTWGQGADQHVHALEVAQKRRSQPNARPGEVDDQAVLTSAAGMLARVQLKAEARRERHTSYLKAVMEHRQGFSDWHAQKSRARKRICKEVLTWHAARRRRATAEQDNAERERMQALRENNEEEYMKLLAQTKNIRLQQLMSHTTQFMDQISRRVARIKTVDQVAEEKRKREERQKGSGVGRGKKKGDQDAHATTAEAIDTIEAEVSEVAAEAGVPSEAQGQKYMEKAHSVHEDIVEQPSSLKFGKLKPYQIFGLNWLVSLYNNKLNGILADEMGLGKTIQTISLVAHLMEHKQNFGPYLVVVPLSTMSNWSVEFERWLPDCLVCEYQGLPDERRRLYREMIANARCNVVLTSYEMCIKDDKFLNKLEWQYLIIDEGHRIKNRDSILATILRGYLTHHRLLLTGTPLQNNIGELWSLLNFLLPAIFQNSQSFEDWFNAPFAVAKVASTEQEEGGILEPTQEEKMLIIMQLHKVLRPFLLRRLKTEVETQLPDKHEIVLKCALSAMQKAYYNLMVRDGIMLLDPTRNVSGKNKAKQGFNNTVMQLKKICNHPYLFLDEYVLNENLIRTSGKFELMDRVLPKMKIHGHRVLVFTQMTSVLDIMEEYLWLRGFGGVTRAHPYENEDDFEKNSRIVLAAQKKAEAEIRAQTSRRNSRRAARELDERNAKNETPNQKRLRLARYAQEDDEDTRDISFEDFLPKKHVDYLRLDGHTGAKERREQMNLWNTPNSPYWLFILSTKAGGLGLNLQTADTVIIFDSDWNPQMDLQAQDRAHRIGQTRQVHVYRLISKGTVEEKIYERADFKLKMDQKVIQAGMFDQSDGHSDDRSKKRLEELFALGDEDEHHDVLDDEAYLNDLISRNDTERAAFIQMDELRREREQETESASRLMTREELPEFIMQGEREAEEDRDGTGEAKRFLEMIQTAGRGKREHKRVEYDDGLTELQFARKVEGLSFFKRKARRHGDDSDEEGDDGDDSDSAASSKSQKKKDKKNEKKKRRRSSKSRKGGGHDDDTEAFADDGDDSPSPKGQPARKRQRVEVETGLDTTGWDDLPPLTDPSDFRTDCFNFLMETIDDPENELFIELPDPVEFDFYYDAIASPIALCQIRVKLHTRVYSSAEDFAKDIFLLCANAMQFNVEGSPIYEAAEIIRAKCQSWLSLAPPPPPKL